MHEAHTPTDGFAEQERALRDEVERSERALEDLQRELDSVCLLYTSDAADDLQPV